MTSPALLLSESRRASGMSIRALAAGAGVAASTVLRIEAGQMDPTLSMLERLLAATGNELELATRLVPQLADLSDAVVHDDGGDRIDWTRLRSFLDYLTAHPGQVSPAVARPPAPSRSALLDNMLAGIAETLAEEYGLPTPAWTAQVAPLSRPWLTPGTPLIQERARQSTPPALAARGITLARSSLWR